MNEPRTAQEAIALWTRRLNHAVEREDPEAIIAALRRIAQEGEALLWALSGEPGKGKPQRWTTLH